MTTTVTLRAFAKINLDLRVLGKRPDGYHELRTIFQTISIADVIAIACEPAPTLSIEMDGTVAIEDNLIMRAARLVVKEAQTGAHLRFHLDKRIPMGAGLGGGSSDAAAILRTLPKLLDRPIAPVRLHELATQLGSDVPFFLYGGASVGLGRGEELYPLPDLPPLYGLLVAPEVHVSTAEAYRALSVTLATSSPDHKLAEFGQLAANLESTEALARARNDFEPVVFALHPELARIQATLAAAGAVCARMTGSGSSLFGLFETEFDAAHAALHFSGHRTYPFTLLTRSEYKRATCVDSV